MNRWDRTNAIDNVAAAITTTLDDHENQIQVLQNEVRELKKIIHSYMHPDHPDS